MIQCGNPVAKRDFSTGIKRMPVSVMGGNTVQETDGLIVAVGEDVVLSGFQFRIGIAAGPEAGALLLLASLPQEANAVAAIAKVATNANVFLSVFIRFFLLNIRCVSSMTVRLRLCPLTATR